MTGQRHRHRRALPHGAPPTIPDTHGNRPAGLYAQGAHGRGTIMAKTKAPKAATLKKVKSKAPWRRLGISLMFAGFVLQLMVQPPDLKALRVVLAEDWIKVGIIAAPYAQYLLAGLLLLVSRGIIGCCGIAAMLVGDVTAHQFTLLVPGQAATTFESLRVPLFNLIVMMPIGRVAGRVLDALLEFRLPKKKADPAEGADPSGGDAASTGDPAARDGANEAQPAAR